MQEAREDNYMCLSFNNVGYVAETAAKISDEFKPKEENKSLNGEEQDFEFSLVYDNKFQHIFPVFNRDLLNNDKVDNSIHISMKNLFLEDRETEVDELETKITETSTSKCKKSKPTGYVSKKWKIRDLLRWSNSEKNEMGKEKDFNIIFVSFKSKKTIKGKDYGEVVKVDRKLKPSTAMEAHQALHGKSYRVGNEVDKNRRKANLPYRQDLIGIFASINCFSMIFHPF